MLSLNDLRTMSTYSVKQVYSKLVQQEPRVNWSKACRNRLNLPKHIFLFWLALQRQLQTIEKLHRIGICASHNYFLCGSYTESQSHLFFECDYSWICLQSIKSWLQIRGIVVDLKRWIMWGCDVLSVELGRGVRRAFLLSLWQGAGREVRQRSWCATSLSSLVVTGSRSRGAM